MIGTDPTAALSWNLVDDARQLLAYPFMVNALRAGTVVAVTAAVIGWFVVLRRQSFAGHTIAVVGFPGAAAATLVGVNILFGYFGFCIGAALVISLVPRRAGRAFSQENALTATVQVSLLVLGFLFVGLYNGNLDGIDALLFGSFLGISPTQVVTLLVVGVAVLGALGAICRPLVFASVDPDVAAARGVPVRVLSTVFLVVLGAAAAEASQITGALLVFALLVMPAAAAQHLSARPVVGCVLAVVVGLVVTWLGLAAAYFSPYPVGFWVTSLAFAFYVAATAWSAARARATARRRRGRGLVGGA